MPEKLSLLLSDKTITPTDDYIFSIIGDKKSLWKSIMKHVQENYGGSAGEWNYYNDGKSWLFKLVRKKKTIFWIGILEDTFRVTFWFGDKAALPITESDLPETIKDGFKSAKKYGAIRGVSIIINDSTDLDNVLKLTAIKTALK